MSFAKEKSIGPRLEVLRRPINSEARYTDPIAMNGEYSLHSLHGGHVSCGLILGRYGASSKYRSGDWRQLSKQKLQMAEVVEDFNAF